MHKSFYQKLMHRLSIVSLSTTSTGSN